VGTVTLYATAKGSAFTTWNNAPNFPVTVTSTTSVENGTTTPVTFALEQNYPNPFNPATKIRFSVPDGIVGATSLRIYDMLGREIGTLVDGALQAGTYTAEWNAGNLASGIYFFRLTAGQNTLTKKMLLQR
jgi:hypothetical protein